METRDDGNANRPRNAESAHLPCDKALSLSSDHSPFIQDSHETGVRGSQEKEWLPRPLGRNCAALSLSLSLSPSHCHYDFSSFAGNDPSPLP